MCPLVIMDPFLYSDSTRLLFHLCDNLLQSPRDLLRSRLTGVRPPADIYTRDAPPWRNLFKPFHSLPSNWALDVPFLLRTRFSASSGLAFVPAFRPQDNHRRAPSCVQIYPRYSTLVPSFQSFSFSAIQLGVGCAPFATDPTRRCQTHGICFVPAFRPQDNHRRPPSCVQIYPRCSTLAPLLLLFPLYTIQLGVGCVFFATDLTRRFKFSGISFCSRLPSTRQPPACALLRIYTHGGASCFYRNIDHRELSFRYPVVHLEAAGVSFSPAF
ncbi:hypothetical protein FPV67DRAFT_2026 [Lyophyllum atratum]|nr:hypothetical protein FPV67DRAFT_2026 [Lyophyllum atratum]